LHARRDLARRLFIKPGHVLMQNTVEKFTPYAMHYSFTERFEAGDLQS
jgi:hypothetical protein